MVFSFLSLVRFPLTILELTVSRDVVVKPYKNRQFMAPRYRGITPKFGQLFSYMAYIQTCGRRVTILLPASGIVMGLVWECRNLLAHQFLMKYPNLRRTYYYFWSLKQTAAILQFYFRLRSSTFCRQWHGSTKSDNPHWVMTSYRVLGWRPWPHNNIPLDSVSLWCHWSEKVKVFWWPHFNISIHSSDD